MIEIKNMKKIYKMDKEDVVVLNIDYLKFEEGTSYLIKGASGKGKTTLLNCLCGIEDAEGSITIDGVQINALSQRERDFFRATNIGYVFQDFNLMENFSAVDNIALPLSMVCKMSKKEAYERANEALAAVGIDNLGGRTVKKLSGGERQRVAFARAFSNGKKVLLADEPTGNLDKENASALLQIMRKVAGQNNSILIVVSHDQTVEEYFDQTIDISSICGAKEVAV